jgi:WS/DGAT/MGAT family acyltransferase
MAKLHHALCDAYGAIGLSRGLFDGPTRQESSAARPVPSPAPPTLSGTSLAGRLSRPDRLVGAAIRTATDAASQALAVLGIASDVVGKLRLPPASPLRAAPSGARRVIMVRLGVHELQLIRRRHGGTTHDALLAVVSGALHEWMIARGHPVGRLRLRALIPASQRRWSSNQAGGNHLSGYLCHLPVGEPDPTKRLQAIRTTMDHNKAAGPRRGPGALPVLAGALPHAVHRLATPLAGHAAPWLFDLVITTVPVPGTPLRLGGAHLRELYPLAPLAHGHALSIALSTYRDSVHIGLHADRDALPDIDKLAEALPGAITDLHNTGRG